MLKMIPMWK